MISQNQKTKLKIVQINRVIRKSRKSKIKVSC